jgi:hypothetical protein
MFWLAFRSGYASETASSRPSAPPSCASALFSALMAEGSPGLPAAFWLAV